MPNKTVVYDTLSGKTYVGNFSPNNSLTAHQNLCNTIGLNPANCIGGSLRTTSDHYGTMTGLRLNSESLNRNIYGMCQAPMSAFSNADWAFHTGGYYTVSNNGNVNLSQNGYRNYWSYY